CGAHQTRIVNQCAPVAQMRQGQVRRDAKEPAARLLVVADDVEALPGAEKNFLGQGIGTVLLAPPPPEGVENLGLVPPDEIFALRDDEIREPMCRTLPDARGGLRGVMPEQDGPKPPPKPARLATVSDAERGRSCQCHVCLPSLPTHGKP